MPLQAPAISPATLTLTAAGAVATRAAAALTWTCQSGRLRSWARRTTASWASRSAGCLAPTSRAAPLQLSPTPLLVRLQIELQARFDESICSAHGCTKINQTATSPLNCAGEGPPNGASGGPGCVVKRFDAEGARQGGCISSRQTRACHDRVQACRMTCTFLPSSHPAVGAVAPCTSQAPASNAGAAEGAPANAQSGTPPTLTLAQLQALQTLQHALEPSTKQSS